MLTPQLILPLAAALVIDLFAGGGGASEGIEQAIGRHVDIAVNHDPDAIGMHQVNHPQTKHYLSNVWEVDPLEVTRGRPVGLLHASPDCTDHSQALGGQPRNEQIRSLAWVVHRWAGKVRPTVITLENVEQMLRWSPLIAKRDAATGRVVTLDKVMGPNGKNVYRIADVGERVPRHRQYLVPDETRLGSNWRNFVEGFRRMGYKVEWKVIVNADLGAHSSRRRLYMIARCDGQPIVWPESTHAKRSVGCKRRKPWMPASDCIDWSVRGNSIFGRKKPLVPASMRRIAYGTDRFILKASEPFIVPATHADTSNRSRGVSVPLPTVTAANRGELMLVAPALVQLGYGERKGQAPRALDIQNPLGTIVAGGGKFGLTSAYLVQAGHGEGHSGGRRWSYGANDITGPLGTVTASGGGQSVATAFLLQANGGFNEVPARDVGAPMSTVTTKGSQQQLVTAQLTTLRRHSIGRDMREPITDITAGGEHHGLVTYHLSREHEEGALRCARFLLEHGVKVDRGNASSEPTIDELLKLVTVWIHGEPWVIVDICLRMLLPRELYNAQDFPASYVIDRTSTGKALTKTAQIRMCGNSVSPLPMRLIVSKNYSDHQLQAQRMAA